MQTFSPLFSPERAGTFLGGKGSNFDWLGELQTTPRKTLKSFLKPQFYLLALALLALALAPRTNGERITYGNK